MMLRATLATVALILPLLGGCAARRVDLAPCVETAPAASGALNWRAVGPLLENRSSTDGQRRLRALPRPLFSEYRDDSRGWLYRDYCWPLAFSRYRQDGGYDYALLAFHSFENPDSPTQVTRWWLVPFLFFGTDSQGKSYAAVFPIYGRIGNLVTYDWIRFCLCPLYLETERAGAHSQTLLWPIFSRTDGERIKKRRVFPIYGYSRTPRQEAQFILWPFGHTLHQYPDAAGKEGRGWFLFPLYGQYRETDATATTIYRSWTFLWPFFSGEKGANAERFHGPWPFYRRENKPAADLPVEQFHLWPFYGHTSRGTQDTTSIAWPFYRTTTKALPNTVTSATVLNPFYQAGRKVENGETVARYLQFWPLWRYEREADASRTAVLALWPFRNQAPIERNFAPFWTLYTCERQAASVRHEAFWGWFKIGHNTPDATHVSLAPLVDYAATAEGYSFSLGKGLIAWGRDGDQASGRFLWFIKW